MFLRDLSWNTFQKPLSIQWCSESHTGDLSEEFDAACTFEILSTAKRDNASVSTIADEEENYHSGGQKFFLSFQFMPMKPL